VGLQSGNVCRMRKFPPRDRAWPSGGDRVGGSKAGGARRGGSELGEVWPGAGRRGCLGRVRII